MGCPGRKRPTNRKNRAESKKEEADDDDIRAEVRLQQNPTAVRWERLVGR